MRHLGECLTSVHAAQLPGSFLSSKCIGMVGIPYGLTQHAGELDLAGDHLGFTVLGVSKSLRMMLVLVRWSGLPLFV